MFQVKKEADETRMSFDEFVHIRNKEKPVSVARAFYDVLVLGRIGRMDIYDENAKVEGRFSKLNLVIH
jgi:hypothetical protein